jgi:hypothetical protein
VLSKQELRDSFASALNNSLLLRYQKMPSAAFVAKEFNLRSHMTDAITQESARRWLRGLAIPDFAKLLVLRSWLDIDLNTLGMPNIESLEKRNIQLSADALAKQEAFVLTTQSIKQTLQGLMKELENLEGNLEQKRRN